MGEEDRDIWRSLALSEHLYKTFVLRVIVLPPLFIVQLLCSPKGLPLSLPCGSEAQDMVPQNLFKKEWDLAQGCLEPSREGSLGLGK